MESRQVPRLALAGIAAVLFVAAGLVYRMHVAQPLAEPDVSTRALFTAAAAGELDAFKSAATPSFYTAFVGLFGEAKLRRTQQILVQVQRQGLARWYEIRQRTVAAAAERYDQLRAQVAAVGREELTKLPVEQRMKLLDEKGNDAFIDLGLAAISPEQRALIRDIEAFRIGRDRDDFAESHAWDFASAEDKKDLGSASALSVSDTPEKEAFLDRVGRPLLPPALAAELGDIQRSELVDEAAFKFKYGEPVARAYLAEKTIPAAVAVDSCSFARADNQGGLLRGTESACLVQAPDIGKAVLVGLRKVDAHWLVSSVTPALYSVWPSSRSR